MLRHQYLLLLSGSLALAAVVCIQPNIGTAPLAVAGSPESTPWDPYDASPVDPSLAVPAVRNPAPVAPYQPVPATRPASWPGAPAAPAAGPAVQTRPQSQQAQTAQSSWDPLPARAATPYSQWNQNTTAPAPSSSQWAPNNQRVADPYSYTSRDPRGATPAGPTTKPCDGAQILARVGDDVILFADVAAAVNEVLQRNAKQIPPDQLEKVRKMLVQKQLEVAIEHKLIYLDAKSSIPEEAMPNVQKQLSKQFYDVQVKNMMKVVKVDTVKDLETYLEKLGTSLEREEEAFSQRALAQQWVHQKIKADDPVTHEQMLRYYEEHLSDFEHPAKARWEELSIRLSSNRRREDAYATLARMGNLVLDGVPLAEVAKRDSEGTTASEGGRRDWTTKGSLVSTTLDNALFGLPVGQLSPILEDNGRLYIVRVIERKDAGRDSFVDTQGDIREKILKQRFQEKTKEYLEDLKRKTPVWTVFDDTPAAAAQTARQSNSSSPLK